MPSYKGLPMRTAPGLHETSFRLLHERRPPPATAIDLGAGEGAFTLRLQEAGYACQAAEIVPERFRVAGVRCHKLDLNADFAASVGQTFDLVVAQEIIEHLENPRHFLRQCRKLVAPGGYLLLTTPNIEDLYSRLRFLLRGRFSFFDEWDYLDSGHRTPLASWQLRQIFREVGLVEAAHSYNQPFRRLFLPGSGSDLKKLLVGLAFWPLTVGVCGGQVHVFVLQSTVA
jgi:SAM-dependent methyltransferase